MNHHHHLFALSLVALAALAGCSTTPPYNANLAQARQDFQSVQANAAQLAPAELGRAAAALTQASEAQSRSEPEEDINHLAYIASQRVAIARETAMQRQAEQDVLQATAERDKMRLAARTNEADSARQQVVTAQQEASTSMQMADDAQARNRDLEAQLKEMNARPSSRGMVVTIGDVLFDTDQAEIKSGGEHQLDKLAAFLARYPSRRAMIEGYTDSVGHAEHNQVLSQRRADAVRARLIAMGIAAGRVQAHGSGEASPIATNDTAAGRQRNRRVEVVLSDDSGDMSSR